MLGKWYGKQPTSDGGIHEWLVNRAPDGTYVIQFKRQDSDGNIKKYAEVGQWGISGDVYFTIYRGKLEYGKIYPSDMHDPTNYDAYNIVKLSESQFKYRHARTKDLFEVKKVSNDYVLE